MSDADFDRLMGALTSGQFEDAGALLPAPARALLTYAAKLTLTPGAMTQDDVGALKAAQFSDRAIHDACAIVGYFAFVNRMADGLGVELET